MFSLNLIYSSSFKNHQYDDDSQISSTSHLDSSLKYQMHVYNCVGLRLST